MRVCGFSFIKNAVKYDFPFSEAIRSVLPLCDEMLIAHGDSDDTTEKLLQQLPHEKIRIIHTQWDSQLIEDGAVLADETNKALDAISEDFDWLFYIQGDEVVHENDHETVRTGMEKYLDDPQVEGLLFKFKHFYGGFHYVADSRSWYDHEVRIIRNDETIRSFKDAQGFRKNGQKLKVKKLNATIYHYGWVKPPLVMGEKLLEQIRFRSDASEENIRQIEAGFDYSGIESVARFTGSHPAVMLPRIEQKNWNIALDTLRKNMSLKRRMHHWLEKLTGRRWFYFRNYEILK